MNFLALDSMRWSRFRSDIDHTHIVEKLRTLENSTSPEESLLEDLYQDLFPLSHYSITNIALAAAPYVHKHLKEVVRNLPWNLERLKSALLSQRILGHCHAKLEVYPKADPPLDPKLVENFNRIIESCCHLARQVLFGVFEVVIIDEQELSLAEVSQLTLDHGGFPFDFGPFLEALTSFFGKREKLGTFVTYIFEYEVEVVYSICPHCDASTTIDLGVSVIEDVLDHSNLLVDEGDLISADLPNSNLPRIAFFLAREQLNRETICILLKR